jgi:N-succinyldiaminopimelate aminotransferase
MISSPPELPFQPAIDALHPYPFERLSALLSDAKPPQNRSPILLSIGEPKHAPPPLAVAALTAALGELGTYPATLGLPEFRTTVGNWLNRRYRLDGAVDPASMVLPVNGTREALFAVAQSVVDPRADRIVAMPNPCYQIYEGAALLAGATPYYLNTTAENGFLPDLHAVPDDVWRRCSLLYLCSPGNPTGAISSLEFMSQAIELADRFGFVIASDECYSEIYDDEASPPPGFLSACRHMGRRRFERVVVFHSLSKRSSLPGLRSGFVAGDPRLLDSFRRYRTYHGCALPIHVQRASIAAWNDEEHVIANRALYRKKFDVVLPILSEVIAATRPAGGFYLWPDIAGDDQTFTRELFISENVTVVPGSYLARDTPHGNPGKGRVRISLVAPLADCVEAAQRIVRFIKSRRT